MTDTKLRGVIAAVATAVDETGAPDAARSVKLARFLLDTGCDGLNVLGTTGEATSFSLDQRKAVMSHYKSAGLPMNRLMVGTGAAATIDAIALTQLGVLYAAFLLPHYTWLHRLPDPQIPGVALGGWRWVLLALVVAMAGDVGGYFGGRYYGRHKLIPEVSPGKTVEGTAAAFGANMLGGLFCKLTFFSVLGWGEVIALSMAAGSLAQVGDLCESMLKRAFGAKDSGWIIPGHGGVLDRIDSLVFPAPLLYYYAKFIFGH